jgi:lipopolysaccharide/colanic/teichoic acid biosynthesis glycosyltransferase
MALAVRMTSPGPAFFLQVRTGLHAKPFRILKFRTMKPRALENAPLLTASDDSRITGFGRWLRKTKIDELPQLINVLKGDMSFVGPRPEVPRYTSKYSESQARIFAARPGITGPSIILNEEQLMANQADKERFYLTVILPAKLEIDLAYCEHITFSQDLRYILLTLARLGERSQPNAPSTDTIQHLARIGGSTLPRSGL